MQQREFTLSDWHRRFQYQASWTNALRQYLIDQSGISKQAPILEVGCGTGAVLERLYEEGYKNLTGIDIDLSRVSFASGIAPSIQSTRADGFQLPFPSARFSLCFCHYLLLWVRNPMRLIREMQRVTKPGGRVIALAEPDYTARIDYPENLVPLGHAQNISLQSQGVDIAMGRKLKALFIDSGLQTIQTGSLGAQWQAEDRGELASSEQEILSFDLGESTDAVNLDPILEKDRQAWLQGKRILFIPTFYASGKVPHEKEF